MTKYDVHRAVKEFAMRNGKDPKYIYVDDKRFRAVMVERDSCVYIKYQEHARPTHFIFGAQLIRVDEPDHFNIC